jgi:DNA-binding transcriptional LysR family regulator
MTTATLPKTPRPDGTPTPHEIATLCHAVNRGGIPEAARHLNLTPATVRHRLRRAYAKYGVPNMARAALAALAAGHVRLYRDGTIAPVRPDESRIANRESR